MTDPLRLLCFLPDLDAGGAQRTVVNLVNALPRDRVSPRLIVARGGGQTQADLADDIAVDDLGARRVRGAIAGLRDRIRRDRPDLLLSTFVAANIGAMLATRGMAGRPPVILRETNTHRHRPDFPAVLRWGARWAYPRAERVIALSEGVRRELIESYRLDPARTVTLHNPVEVSDMAAAAAAARSEPPPWRDRLAGDAPVVIGIGRLVPQKGFDLLIEAVAALADRSVRLVILGDGPQGAALRTLGDARGLGPRLYMPGHVRDPARWLAHADLFVLSSRWEGFGHVLVEAMACGAPVLATDCPYGPADVLREGESGILVAPGRAEDLSSAMARLLRDSALRRRLAAAGRERARIFEADRIAAAYADLFDATSRAGIGG